MHYSRNRRKKPTYREIDRERFRLTHEQPPSSDHTVPLDKIIPKIIKGMGLEQDLWEQQLMGEWPKLVGPQLSRHARPGKVERKILFVYVTSSAWLQELTSFGQREILKKVQDNFGADRIRSIRLRLDPDMGR